MRNSPLLRFARIVLSDEMTDHTCGLAEPVPRCVLREHPSAVDLFG